MTKNGEIATDSSNVDYWLAGCDSSGLLSDDYLIWNSNRNNTDFKIEHDTGYVQIGKNNGSRDADSPLSVISDNSSSGYALKVGAGGGGSEDRGIYIYFGRNVPTSSGSCVYIGFHDGDGSSAGGIRCSSTPSAPEFFAGSDIRMKKNIEDCEINGLDIIKSLKLRKWDWNTEKDMSSTDIGLVADELEEVYPDLISRQKIRWLGTLCF